jgi:uncharacterized phage infection (PIP) family protein YhgE
MSETQKDIEVKAEEAVVEATEVSAPVDAVEGLLDSLQKSLNEKLAEEATNNHQALEAIAKGCDSIVEKANARHDDLNVRINDLSDVVKAIATRFDELFTKLSEKTAELDKSLTQIADEPVVKSVSAVQVVPHPVEAKEEVAPVTTSFDLINKAMTEIKDASDERRGQLCKAISQLESGLSPVQVKNDFNL